MNHAHASLAHSGTAREDGEAGDGWLGDGVRRFHAVSMCDGICNSMTGAEDKEWNDKMGVAMCLS